MTTTIADALLETLLSVEAYAGETFELDTAMKVLEDAGAILRSASPEEKQLLIERAQGLAAKNPADPERVEFMNGVAANLLGTND
jgi:hypothetical protein